MTNAVVPIVTFLFAITALSLPYYIYVDRENKRLRKSIDDYGVQLKYALDSWRDCIDDYTELADEYHKLFSYYNRAYGILEEHGLLPGDEE